MIDFYSIGLNNTTQVEGQIGNPTSKELIFYKLKAGIFNDICLAGGGGRRRSLSHNAVKKG
jgi:hypothetical protein